MNPIHFWDSMQWWKWEVNSIITREINSIITCSYRNRPGFGAVLSANPGAEQPNVRCEILIALKKKPHGKASAGCCPHHFTSTHIPGAHTGELFRANAPPAFSNIFICLPKQARPRDLLMQQLVCWSCPACFNLYWLHAAAKVLVLLKLSLPRAAVQCVLQSWEQPWV